MRAGGDVTETAEHSIIVDRFGKGVEERSGEAAAEPAPQLDLPLLAGGIATRALIDEARRTGGTGVRCSDRVGVRQELLDAARAFDAQVGGCELQRGWQIALQRQLPDLGVADAEIGIDGEGVVGGRGA